ncbi:MAG: sulfite reductase flavoprotein subunit alpha, partial [Ectothiorhodospiraceae bacterium]
MQSKALDTTNSPLTNEQADYVNRLVTSLSPDQVNWISGYLAGLHSAQAGGQAESAPAGGGATEHTLTILYGSETGNAQGVAEQAGEQASARGLPVRVMDMADYKHKELGSEHLLMVVTATHGEGDPPDPATDFYEFLYGRKAPKLQGAKFAVLSLGDTSYEHFCQTGKDFDARLEALGGERLVERVDCDVDYEDIAADWISRALDGFQEHAVTGPSNVVAMPGSAVSAKSGYDRKNPFAAEVLENLVLNGRGSEKETRHVELSLEGSGITYQPGDVLCLLPRNHEGVVNELIETLALDPQTNVNDAGDGERPLVEALTYDYEVTNATPAFVSAYAQFTGAEELRRLTEEAERSELMAYLEGRHVIDIVTEYPPEGLDAATFVGMLRRLQPREYSIASSHEANPGEVHLTVEAVR